MGDIGLFTFPYQNLSVPNGIPFYPKITQTGEDITVTFNQGYVFDYTSAKDGAGVRKIKVTNCDTEYSLSSSNEFYLEIKTTSDLANIKSAEVKQGTAEADEKSHYSAKNLWGEEVYEKNSDGSFKIAMCKIDKDGNIENLYLRENIHWQKINFENTKKEQNSEESFGVLYNWGDEENFNDNPTVKFSNLVQLVEEEEQIIKLKKSVGGQNIVITTQLPLAGSDEMSVLYRSKTNEWIWLQADQSKYQLLVSDKGELKFFDAPESASDGLQLLGYDASSSTLKWVETEECPTSSTSPTP
jgi:hypothetical protein